MKNRIPLCMCFNLILDWWNGEKQQNVLNGIMFYNLHSHLAYYTIHYYNTNVCKHQSIKVVVNRETNEVKLYEEMKK